MTRYEYKIVPAPQKGTKAKGVKTPEGRFAVSIEQLLNQLGQEGWEYQRAELLPSEERTGLTGSTVNWRNVLVFRRLLLADADLETAKQDDAPQDVPLAQPIPGPVSVTAPAAIAEAPQDPPLSLKPADAAKNDDADNTDDTPEAADKS